MRLKMKIEFQNSRQYGISRDFSKYFEIIQFYTLEHFVYLTSWRGAGILL